MRRAVVVLLGLSLVTALIGALSSDVRGSAPPASPALTGTAHDAWDLAGTTAPATVTGSPSKLFINTDTGFEGGEPTLAALKDGSIVAQAMTTTVKSTDGGRTWKEVHSPPSGTVSLDPYIHADAKTQRILSSQLLGACQMLSLSDDAGKTWVDVPTQCPSGDHQKIGSGPWHDPANKPYPRAFYTCLNRVVDTACAMSYDGGLTWAPPVTVFPGFDPAAEKGLGGIAGDCGGLEGDPVSAPDGTIYVPREFCGRPFVGVSKDDGLTWTRHWVAEDAQTRPIAWGGNNPSVYVDAAGTVFYAWTGADWSHYVSYSKDQGETWSKALKLSPPGIKSTTFPSIIAGRPGAVATSFVGTSAGPANPGDVGNEARWHLFVSYSLNGSSPGARWRTVRVTDHPIQIGCIGRHGGKKGCGRGNLLDFNDMSLTRDGRVAISYTDGCLATCTSTRHSTQRRLAVAVQVRGPRFSGRAPILIDDKIR